jgi:ferredoxin
LPLSGLGRRARLSGGADVNGDGRRLAVDPIACDGHGLCADMLPEVVALDEWGYPLIDPRPLCADLLAHAKRAVAACPTLALRLGQAEPE